MSVKAGDLAIIKSTSARYNGRIVEVISRPPPGPFTLPDGYPHGPSVSPATSWIVKAVGGPLPCPLEHPNWCGESERRSWYGVAGQSALRPLPGETEDIDLTHELTI